MNLDRCVLIFAGSMILISLALSQFFSHYWLLLTAWIGLMMLQSAFTGFCPVVFVFKKVGVKPGGAFQ
jgi:Protein of unknown function (DUF2892)